MVKMVIDVPKKMMDPKMPEFRWCHLDWSESTTVEVVSPPAIALAVGEAAAVVVMGANVVYDVEVTVVAFENVVVVTSRVMMVVDVSFGGVADSVRPVDVVTCALADEEAPVVV